VLGALVVQLILGTVYAFSVFVTPLEREFGWDRATTQWAFSFALAAFALVMIPAGRLQDRIGPRRVAMIGGALLGLSFILGALLVRGESPWILYLTYGVVGGAGIGFGYVCPIAAAVKWYPDKKGLITGLAVAGFGAGALFVTGPASVLLLPPAPGGEGLGLSEILLVGLGLGDGQAYGIGWRAFFVLHGLVCAVAVIAGAMLLRNPPPGWQPEGWTPPPNRKAPPEWDWHAVLNSPLAMMLWMAFILGATSGLMAIGQWEPMMTTVMRGQRLAPDWLGGLGRYLEPVGVLAVFNGLGRVFWGRISDLLDRPRAMMMMFLAQGLAFMLLAGVSTPWGVFLASAWVGLNFGGNFALFPTATADYFGMRNFGVNYGLIFTGYGIAGVIGPVVGGVLFDATGQYLIPFVFAGILSFMAAVCCILIFELARRGD